MNVQEQNRRYERMALEQQYQHHLYLSTSPDVATAHINRVMAMWIGAVLQDSAWEVDA